MEEAEKTERRTDARFCKTDYLYGANDFCLEYENTSLGGGTEENAKEVRLGNEAYQLTSNIRDT